MSTPNIKNITQNRKALHDFEVLESFEAGICLKGTEIKSIRDTGISLQEAYVRIIKGELYLIGSFIAAYRFGNIHNHEERADRKLLMHNREIRKLQEKVKEKGLTLVPLSLYLKNGRAKLKVGLGKGKKHHDKRDSIKEKEQIRKMQQAVKNS